MARDLPAGAQGFFGYVTRHPTLANLMMVIMLAAGLVAFPNMRAQFFPDVVVDDVTVSVNWDGAGAEDIDSAIVQVLEPTLLVVEGVESSQATSREGRAYIELEFEPGWDMARAADDVQSAVDTVTELPEDADDPTVRRGTWRDRVTDVVITGPVAVDQLGRFADEFVARLFIEGVTRTTIRGVAAPETVIEVPSINLIRHDISMQDIAQAIAGEVDTDPAGDVSGSATRVRTGVEKRSADQIAAIVLRSQTDGTKLTIGDVATVSVAGIDRNRSYFVGDAPAISIRVDRSPQGDAIGIQRQVEEVAAEFQATLPAGTSVDLIRTRAEAINGRLNILLDNALLGLGLVVALLFLFLNARAAFWVAAGIPVALFAAISLMFMAGITINMISLFALIITLGIVVDDAIVVGEHADWRYRHLGEDPYTAATNAARRMALPVLAASLTTIIAFFGLTAVGGRFGDLIADIPFTVIMVLLASLVECFLILPHHMATAMKSTWWVWDLLDTPSRWVNHGFEFVRERAFRPLMGVVIQLRYAILAGTVFLLATQIAPLITKEVPWRFFNAPEQSSVTGNFLMAPGATRADTLEMMRELQRATEALGLEYEERYGRNPIAYVIAEVGGNTGRSLAGSEGKDRDLLGGVAIELIDRDLRSYSSFRFVGELQRTVERHPMVETLSFRRWGSGPGGDKLSVQFYGADLETLKTASEALQTELAQFAEVSAVEDNLAYDKEELILELTPQGQALGFTIDGLGRVLRHRLGGIEAATYPDGVRSAEIRVELPAEELTADFLDRMQMRTATGAYVPLADIVTVDRRTGFSSVRRENGLRMIEITGDVSEDDAARASEIVGLLEADILPRLSEQHEVGFQLTGEWEQEAQFIRDTTTGLVFVLLGIYLVLSWIFASWSRPLVVMSIIPFGLVGTVYGHAAWDVPMSMFTVVGLLGMTGIIINDSIVLITTIDEKARDRGMVPAIIDGAVDRLRPVLLTTLTTVLGLTPLLYEGSAQAEFLKPTVITLVYGLGFGMLLVLLVVPSLLAIQTDVARLNLTFWRGMRFRAGRARVALTVAFGVMLAWLAATLGSYVVQGGVPAALQATLPIALESFGAVFLVYMLGAMVICGVAYVIAVISVLLARRQSAV